MLFFHSKPKPVYLFRPGDRVAWNAENALPGDLIAKNRADFGDGPFTIERVHDVDPEDQHGTLHTQMVIVKELVGKVYKDPDLGTMRCEGVFSGAYFKPVGAS